MPFNLLLPDFQRPVREVQQIFFLVGYEEAVPTQAPSDFETPQPAVAEDDFHLSGMQEECPQLDQAAFLPQRTWRQRDRLEFKDYKAGRDKGNNCFRTACTVCAVCSTVFAQGQTLHSVSSKGFAWSERCVCKRRPTRLIARRRWLSLW